MPCEVLILRPDALPEPLQPPALVALHKTKPSWLPKASTHRHHAHYGSSQETQQAEAGNAAFCPSDVVSLRQPRSLRTCGLLAACVTVHSSSADLTNALKTRRASTRSACKAEPLYFNSYNYNASYTAGIK